MGLDITGKRPVRSQILRSTYLCFRLFLNPLVLFYRLGRDGGRGFALRGVVLLNVSCGSGDSPPCLATTDAASESGQNDCTKQDQGFRFELSHLR